MRLHPPCPLLQFTPLKFENLINLAKSCIIWDFKYPVYRGSAPQTPYFRDIILGLAPPGIEYVSACTPKCLDL